MRTALVSLALLLPTAASAGVGLGTTMGLGSGQVVININGNGGVFGPGTAGGFLPSLDLHFDTFVLQIHALETLTLLSDNTIFLGANAYFEMFDQPLGGNFDVVIAPGGGLDLIDDAFALTLTAEGRFGVRSRGGAGIGVFVVPALGVVVGDVDSDLVSSGTLQVSMWFGGAGSRSGGTTRAPSQPDFGTSSVE